MRYRIQAKDGTIAYWKFDIMKTCPSHCYVVFETDKFKIRDTCVVKTRNVQKIIDQARANGLSVTEFFYEKTNLHRA